LAGALAGASSGALAGTSAAADTVIVPFMLLGWMAQWYLMVPADLNVWLGALV
jgi:hypothetical protein